MSKKDWETNGLHNGEPIYCPVNACGDCLYCDQANICHIADPIENCDDFGVCFSDWEEWERADEMDDNRESFVEEEIEWARERYGYRDERG